jgi:outer membrane protein assembly factor BamB
MTGLLLMAMILLNSCSNSAGNNNWPQFRGPDANMVVSGADLPTTWGEDLNVAWTFDVDGDSWTSPIVWGNRVFIASALAVKINKPAEGEDQGLANEDLYLQDIYRWELSCVDLETGIELWREVALEGSPRIKKHAATNYASETPVTDGKRIFAYFGMTGLFCYDMDGVLLWKKDLGAFETQRGWGTGSSPVLYKNSLFIQVDNEEQSFLVALDAASGDEIWRTDRDEKTNYGTPYLWKNSVRTELVCGGKRARAYDPDTGELIWELGMDGHYNIPSPTANQNLLFMGNSGYGDVPGTYFAIKAGAEGDITPDSGSMVSDWVLWSDADAPLGSPSPLLHEGLIYIVSSRGGEVTCLEAETGKIVYQEKIEKVAACWASPWAYEDKIFFMDEKGLTRAIKAGRDFELLHENKLDDRFWASVAVAGDALLFKGDQKLYCIKNQ